MSDWADSLTAGNTQQHLLHVRGSTFLDPAISPAERWSSPDPAGEAWDQRKLKEGFVQENLPVCRVSRLCDNVFLGNICMIAKTVDSAMT